MNPAYHKKKIWAENRSFIVTQTFSSKQLSQKKQLLMLANILLATDQQSNNCNRTQKQQVCLKHMQFTDFKQKLFKTCFKINCSIFPSLFPKHSTVSNSHTNSKQSSLSSTSLHGEENVTERLSEGKWIKYTILDNIVHNTTTFLQ